MKVSADFYILAGRSKENDCTVIFDSGSISVGIVTLLSRGLSEGWNVYNIKRALYFVIEEDVVVLRRASGRKMRCAGFGPCMEGCRDIEVFGV